jgi:hypothetical protein
MVESKSEIKFLLEKYDEAAKTIREISHKLKDLGLTVVSAQDAVDGV